MIYILQNGHIIDQLLKKMVHKRVINRRRVKLETLLLAKGTRMPDRGRILEAEMKKVEDEVLNRDLHMWLRDAQKARVAKYFF